jgi:hypothetical protein
LNDLLKTISGFLLGILGLIAIAVIAGLLILGGAWLSDKIYPWLIVAFAIALAVIVFVLLPLAIFRRTRGFSGIGIFIASYVFGATLWVWSLLITYTLWGGLAVFIGLIMAGIGIVPLAIFATLFKGMWSILGQIVLLLIFTLGARFFGIFLISKSEKSE